MADTPKLPGPPTPPSDDDEWQDALEKWDANFDGFSGSSPTETTRNDDAPPGMDSVDLSLDDVATGELPAPVSDAHAIGVVPRPEAVGESAGMVIPDVHELELAAARPATREPAEETPAIPLADATAVSPMARQVEGRSLREADGLPELTDVLHLDAPAAHDTERTQETLAFDPFTHPLPQDAPIEIAACLPAAAAPDAASVRDAIVAALPQNGPRLERSRAYVREQVAIFQEEQTARTGEGGAASAALLNAAARATERLDPRDALALYDEALALEPTSLVALRGRFRLRLACGRDDAGDALARLCALVPVTERAGYAFIARTFAALHPGKSAPIGRGAAEDEPLSAAARAASSALTEGAPAQLADRLDTLAQEISRSAGSPLSLALRQLGARVRELAGEPSDSSTALGTSPAVTALAGLRRATRSKSAPFPSSESLNAVAEPLRSGLLRWSYAIATSRKDDGAAAHFNTALLDGDEALLLDRLRALASAGASEGVAQRAAALVAERRADPMRALLTWRLAVRELARDQHVEALARIGRELAAAPDAVPLALVAEALSRASDDPLRRLAARELWASGDPGRRAAALDALLDEPSLDEPRRQRSYAALLALDPQMPRFLQTAWQRAAAGQFDEAISLLSRIADAADHRPPEGGTPASPFVAALRRRIDDLREAQRPESAVAQLLSTRPDRPEGATTLAHTLLHADEDPRSVVDAFVAAAERTGSPWRRLEAAAWLLQTETARDALALLRDCNPSGLPAAGALLLQRLSRLQSDAAARLQLLTRLDAAAPQADRAELTFLRAEALEALGNRAEAADLYRDLLAGPFAVDAELALRRLLWSVRDGAALTALLRDEIDARLGAGQTAPAARLLVDKARAMADLRDDVTGASLALAEALQQDEGARADARFMALLLAAGKGDFSATISHVLALSQRGLRSLANGLVYMAALLSQNRGSAEDARSIGQSLRAASHPDRPIALDRLALDLGADSGSAADLERLASRLYAERGDSRLAAALAVRAAERHHEAGHNDRAQSLLERAGAGEEGEQLTAELHLAALFEATSKWPAALAALTDAARRLRKPENRAALLVQAATLAEDRLHDDAATAALLREAFDARPTDEATFTRLRVLHERTGNLEAVADLLDTRATAQTESSDAVELRLERATLLAERLNDRPRAKEELRALLADEPQHSVALSRLAAMEIEDGAFAIGAELLIRQARFEKEPQVLIAIFLQIGRIYQRKLSDPKLATGAFERVVQLDANNREALESLSDLYTKQNDTRKALAATERLTELEPDAVKRVPLLLRQSSLWERAGDVRRSGGLLRKAADDAPRSLQAVGELARFYERTREPQARNVLLDTSIGLLREDLRGPRRSVAALRTLVPLLRWRQRNACSGAAAQLLSVVTDEPTERSEAAAWAAAPTNGRRLAPLSNPELDERLRPAALPGGLRTLMHLIGPVLAKANRPDLRRHQVGRADRAAAGSDVRKAFDPIAADLGVRTVDVYVGGASPTAFVVEPGDPGVVIIGSEVVARGPIALRFVAGHALRLLESHFAVLARGTPADLGALLAGAIRMVSPGHQHPDVPDDAANEAAARLTKLLPARVRSEAAPFIVEIAGPFSPQALHRAVEESAARVGLLGCGDLAASLDVLALGAGKTLSLDSAFDLPNGPALIEFSLSEDFEELVAALEAVS